MKLEGISGRKKHHHMPVKTPVRTLQLKYHTGSQSVSDHERVRSLSESDMELNKRSTGVLFLTHMYIGCGFRFVSHLSCYT